MFNRVFLIGNLTRDPEVRYLPSGTALTTFDIAVNEKFRDRNQELREETLFIRVDTFQKLAETCAQYLKKGRRVFVEGKLRIDSWEGKDGVKRSRPVIRGLGVQFIDSRPAEGAAAAPQAQPAQPAARPAESGGVAEAPRSPAPADADMPYDEGVPEQDINAGPDLGTGEPPTSDDLPF
jgi:single-strand DNA-binding protein